MGNKSKQSRRSFVKRMAGSLLAAGATPHLLFAKDNTKVYELPYQQTETTYSAGDKIQIACIGMGIMGFNNCSTALRVPGVELVAVCDLYNGRLERSKEVFGTHLFTTSDYREVLQRNDIDAVIVATSDHWHDRITIDALNAGKAVYCEKPMVHHLDEGLPVIEAQKKSGKVLQVGSQRVSSIITQKAKELYEKGAIGKLNLVETWNDRQSALGAWQYSIPSDASPQTVDWDRFIGDAPKLPFDKVRFFRWRNYQDYGTGVAGDLFVHLFSGLHATISSNGPERVFATGGLRHWKDGRDVPDVIIACCDYPDTKNHPAFNMQLRVNFVDGKGGSSKIRVVGSEGAMEIGGDSVKIFHSKMAKNPGYGGWDSYNTFSRAGQLEYEKWYNKKYQKPVPEMLGPQEEEYRAPEGYSSHLEHFTNFFDAIRHDKTVVEDAAFGFRAAAPSLAANVSYFEKRVVNWDPEKMVEV